MRKESGLLLAVLLVTLALSAACNRGANAPDLSKLGPSSAATTTVLPVGNPQCPGGGIRIDTGSDANNNGVLEASEALKAAPICGPLPEDGKPGDLVSLVMIASEPTGTQHCAAGGLNVLSGADANRNGVLDAQEIMFTEYLCNGAPGSSSAAGITVASVPPVPADKKKEKKRAPAKKPAAATSKALGKPAPAAPAATDSGSASSAPEEKAREKARPASSKKEKSGSAKPVAPPKGWTTVKEGSSQLASAAYKIEGKYIIVRFTNLSTTSAARCKYTVRWKMNQNGSWVDDSTMEGISFRLNPGESLDREIRTQAQDIRDVVVDFNVVEG